MKQLISLIIPVYNGASCLSNCLKSLVQQTFREIEIVCVNDGSTDQSHALLKDWALKDKRIKVLNKPHSNAGDARNIGALSACGEYVWFVDCDDTVDIDACRKLERYIKNNPPVDIILFDAYRINDGKRTQNTGDFNKKLMPVENPFSPKNHNEKLYQITNPPAWNKLFKLDFIKSYGIKFQSISSSNDVFFTRTALAKASLIGTINEPLYLYCNDSYGAISRSRGENSMNIRTVEKGLRHCLTEHGLWDLYKKTMMQSLASNYRHEFRHSKKLSYKILLFSSYLRLKYLRPV